MKNLDVIAKIIDLLLVSEEYKEKNQYNNQIFRIRE